MNVKNVNMNDIVITINRNISHTHLSVEFKHDDIFIYAESLYDSQDENLMEYDLLKKLGFTKKQLKKYN